MARVIEFHVPSRFSRKRMWVPQEEQGKLLAFPRNLKTQLQLEEEWPPMMTTRQWRQSNSLLTQLLWVLVRPA